MPRPKVAVVVPVFGRLAKTLRFIESFQRVEYDNYEIVIVDDASPDGTAEALARDHPDVVVLPGDGKLWWTGGTNLGVRYALEKGFDYVLTINNDTSVRPDFLTHLVDTAERHGPCIVGSRIQYLDKPKRVWGVGGRTSWRQGVMVSVCDRDADEGELLSTRANPAEVELLTHYCSKIRASGIPIHKHTVLTNLYQQQIRSGRRGQKYKIGTRKRRKAQRLGERRRLAVRRRQRN